MKYPLGIQTFAHIREDDYVYVDKTQLIYELITTGKSFFLSRPRRFGKSLLISTLESLFCGDKALFEGLAIGKTNYDFSAYPVVLFEFTKVVTHSADDVKRYIFNTITTIAKKHAVELTFESYEERLGQLLERLFDKTGKPVVFLVDEYDKPILDKLFSDELQAVRGVLAGFYAMVKQSDRFLKFVFITGVSKFAKVSVFSGMNSLTDISMNKRFAQLCGVTQQELEQNFDEPLSKLAEYEQIDKKALLAKVKLWYNGYHFHHQSISVYNPYSLLSLFYKQEFENFWFDTGTPTFLLNLLQEKQYELKNLTERAVGSKSFAACEPENMAVQSIFLQTGYLTIKSFDNGVYTLGFPNLEVERSFYDSVSERYSGLGAGEEQSYLIELLAHLQAQNFEDFFETLSVFFANIPYDITLKNEKYYQSLFYAIFKLVGLDIEAEVKTNKGRIDCVMQTDNMICIIEFKLNGSKEEALEQIINTQYSQKYQQSDKTKVFIGVEFDQETRNIGGYLIK